MNVMKCVRCGKPIMGYWAVVKKQGNNQIMCIPCSQTTTVWDLVVEGVFGIQPDIAVEVDGDKQFLNSVYGMVAQENTVTDTDSVSSSMDVKSSYIANIEKIAALKESLNKEAGLKLDPDKNLPETFDYMEHEESDPDPEAPAEQNW